jgi:hypothetical protein
MDSLTGLKNAIHIKNEYNRIAAPILEHVKNVSKQFIGKKIDTQKGLSSKFYDALKFDYKSINVKPVDGAKWANVHYVSTTCSYTDIKVEISLCFSDGTTGCTYEKRTWYFGKTDGQGILLSVDENYKVDIDPIDFETELKAILKFRELEAQMERAKDKIRIGRETYQYLSVKDLEKYVKTV